MSDGQTPQYGGPQHPQHPRPADDNPYQRASSGWTGTDPHPTQPQPTYPGLPLQLATHAPSRERKGRGRTGLAAAVVATSLLVGGGAGIGGAAWWDATQDGSGGSSQASPVSTSTVSSQSQAPAADGSVESVAQKVLPSVVKIDVTTAEGGASGSGIILTADGTILTNNHVVEGAEAGSLTVSFDDGTSAKAEVLGTDPLTDTAVIKAEGVSDLTPATIGKSANLGVGESVVAIGSPFGLDATVTSGIVSALDRPVNVGSDDQGNSTTYPAIQTDAAINPGNSGGPLVDLTGAVIGINSSIRTAASQSPYGGGQSESGSIGLGFAIPIDEVMPIVDQMASGETPTHARLGIQVGDAQTGDAAGAVVREVTPGSTADKAGLGSGSVITKVDDQRITGADSLVATIRSYRPGDSVSVTWTSGGKEQSADLVLDSDATQG
ncbi:trypsin-like peptidase domain-containing protein [Nocardioides cavernae]|uniref:Trypsin-like peptidase domain-containing protein n=1 Tax=Nocardioides cavernae TaxID=1921566 RepID=A0ABR8NA04_9ACTN|nr:trypsin-like peptidase domain-containing protein [Nocardioides cavernae]MBD3924971.1 trypsin-like peptidase domain-containing protein [Nocardioides cavernae]MBM7514655.1 putative serine protease PepD [Nocardioides cavernae]